MSVVIAGIGMLTPLGPTRESSWSRLCQGWKPAPPASVATPAGWTIPPEWLTGPPEGTRMEQVVPRAAREALADAGLTDPAIWQSPRFGCVVGTSKGPLDLYQREPAAPGPEISFAQLWPSGPLARLIRELNLRGPTICPVSACATGLEAVLRGVRLIEQGDCDLVLAGSVDASLNPFVLHSYRRLGVLADRHEPTADACKPFDRDRSGFVLGEGAALFVLARADDARLPRDRGYAHWLGGASFGDAAGLTQLDESGIRLSRLLGELIIQADRRTQDVDLLHLHGTGTTANDRAEARAMASVFGPPDQQPWTTASKGAHGHALGAAGSLELGWLLLSLRDGVIPPVWNLRHQDPACPLRAVRERCHAHAARTGLKVSLGFGGHQVACLVERGSRPAQARILSTT